MMQYDGFHPSLIHDFAHQRKITIMYACESGSRAWGFESPDSDYDVRFIYRHPLNWYLTVGNPKDTIETAIGDHDLAGWDIRKALGLFYASNPSLMEWLHSPIVYTEPSPVIEQMRRMSSDFFDTKKASYHYYHMARNNYKKYLDTGADEVWTKKYFYVLRPLLCVEWLQKMRTMPPVKLDELVVFADRLGLLPDGMMPTIDELLARKRAGEELRHGPRLPVLQDWLSSKLDGLEDFDGRKHTGNLEDLNRLFRWAIME